LLHHNKGTPVYHPSVDAIRQIIEESPHKYNHVYHLVDAADFPMSLVPRLHQLVGEIYLRTHNRRSRSKGRFYGDKMVDISFVITRADLLAPTKAQVDSLLPYFREVLRQALGRVGRQIRLGNIHMVSANRGWWTIPLKDEIFRRGGAAWMVGKANVGKSKLFETVFPKGRPDTNPVFEASSEPAPPPGVGEMLPPLRPESPYPDMPTVSSLPGTTASPIRVPFGRGRGELIDLPGLERSQLDRYVQESHQDDLLMKSRITPEQKTIKPDQSLLLGGFIRITPKTPNLIFLAANFTPLHDHVTSTEKAVSIQGQQHVVAVDNISVPGSHESVKLAGTFELAHDITGQRAGPLTRKDAVGLKPERLPFRVLALDLLIEGVGWVEISAQVRTREYPHHQDDDRSSCRQPVDDLHKLESLGEGGNGAVGQAWPAVDVFTPEGRFIASRPPMNGYMLNKSRKTKLARPRRSMKGHKKRMKMMRRQQESARLTGGEVEL
jgi:genetic interactor of prohibitins 3, mitochondrial